MERVISVETKACRWRACVLCPPVFSGRDVTISRTAKEGKMVNLYSTIRDYGCYFILLLLLIPLNKACADITIHSHDAGEHASQPYENSVDDNINTWGGNTSAGVGWIIYDLGTVTNFNMIDITSRDSTINLYPDGWTVSVFGNDNPDTGSEVVIGSTNSINLVSGREQLLRVTDSSKRYVKFAWGSSHGTYSAIAEFHVYNNSAPTKGTFANTTTLNWSTERTSINTADDDVGTFTTYYYGTQGWVIVDLGSVVTVDKLEITSRNHEFHHFPKDVVAYVYDNDDPLTGSEIQVGSGQLPDLADGASAILGITNSSKRYIKFEWTTGWDPAGTGVNIAEISAVPIFGLHLDTTVVLPSVSDEPRLMFYSSDIPTLQSRVNDPAYQQWWTEVLVVAVIYKDKDFADYNMSEVDRSQAAKALAFSYTVTEVTNYLNGAKNALLNIGEGFDDPMENEPDGERSVRCAATNTQSYCEAYDMIKNELSAVERTEIETRLAGLAERFYVHAALDWTRIAGTKHNSQIKPAAALGTIALTIPTYSVAAHTPQEWLFQGLMMMSVGIEYCTDSGGCYNNGNGYRNYTLGNLWPFAEQYRRLCSVDWLSTLEPLFNFILEARRPDGLMPALEDSCEESPIGYLIAQHYFNAAEYVWCYINAIYPEVHDSFDDIYANGLKEVDKIVSYDYNITPQEPNREPTVFNKVSKVAVFRESWDSTSEYAYFNGAADHPMSFNEVPRSHSRPDPLSFTIYADGKILLPGSSGYDVDTLLTDPYWKDPNSNNVMLVNGGAPYVEPGDVTIVHAVDSRSVMGHRNKVADFATMQINYNGADIERTMAFAQEQYFIVADRLTASSQNDYEFILHGRKQLESVTNNSPNHISASWNCDGTKLHADIVSTTSLTANTYEGHYIARSVGLDEEPNYIGVQCSGADVAYLSVLFPHLSGQEMASVQNLSNSTIAAIHLGYQQDSNSIEDVWAARKGETAFTYSVGNYFATDAAMSYVRYEDGVVNGFAVAEALHLDITDSNYTMTCTALFTGSFSLPGNNTVVCIIDEEMVKDNYTLTVAGIEPDLVFFNGERTNFQTIPNGASVTINGSGELLFVAEPTICSDVLYLGYNITGDLNGDCYVSLSDFALFSQNWLRCIDPNNPECQAP